MQKSQRKSQQSQSHDRVLAGYVSQMSQLIAMSAMFGREGGGGWPVRRRGDKDTSKKIYGLQESMAKVACAIMLLCLRVEGSVGPARAL